MYFSNARASLATCSSLRANSSVNSGFDVIRIDRETTLIVARIDCCSNSDKQKLTRGAVNGSQLFYADLNSNARKIFLSVRSGNICVALKREYDRLRIDHEIGLAVQFLNNDDKELEFKR